MIPVLASGALDRVGDLVPHDRVDHLAVVPITRQFPISRPEWRPPPVATPPRALYESGADGHPEATDRRPLRAAITLRQPTDADIPMGCSQKV